MTRVRFAALAGSFALAAVLASCYGKSEAPTGAELDSGNLAPGGTQYAHTFSTAGTFPYHCALHPGCAGLRGSWYLNAAQGGEGVVRPAYYLRWSFSADSAEAKPSGRVVVVGAGGALPRVAQGGHEPPDEPPVVDRW